MNWLLTILTALSALLGAAPFVRPRTAGGEALLWLPKLLGGALSPVTGLAGVLAALAGLARRSPALTGAGLLGAALAARLAASMPDVGEELASLPRLDAQGPALSTGEPPGASLSLVSAGPAGNTGSAEFERNIVVGQKARSGRPLRADLWPPANGLPSGLGLIYAHGSGWRVGDDRDFSIAIRHCPGHRLGRLSGISALYQRRKSPKSTRRGRLD